MLSKTERNYLSGLLTPSHSHKRVLDHRINKKLKEFFRLEFPLIQNSSVTDFSNNVTEFSNTKIISDGMRSPICEANESLGWALTPRPNAYEAFALPG